MKIFIHKEKAKEEKEEIIWFLLSHSLLYQSSKDSFSFMFEFNLLSSFFLGRKYLWVFALNFCNLQIINTTLNIHLIIPIQIHGTQTDTPITISNDMFKGCVLSFYVCTNICHHAEHKNIVPFLCSFIFSRSLSQKVR